MPQERRDVPDFSMPKDMSEGSLTTWLHDMATVGNRSMLKRDWEPVAGAVLALLRNKVREAVEFSMSRVHAPHKGHVVWDSVETITSHVLGSPVETASCRTRDMAKAAEALLNAMDSCEQSDGKTIRAMRSLRDALRCAKEWDCD